MAVHDIVDDWRSKLRIGQANATLKCFAVLE
jgi:hypothetical protein